MSTPREAEIVETDVTDESDDLGAGEAPLSLLAPNSAAGERLDKALAALLPDVSRSRLQQWIECGAVRVDGAAARIRQALAGGERIDIVPPPSPAQLAMQPEPIALDVVYEDRHIAVLAKPPGLVVHPAAGNWSGTLANGLLARFAQTAALPRAGIVHRLDADTSGLMVVALTLQAQTDLVRQLQARTVTREYWAIVAGAAPKAATIEAALARDPRNPLRFAVSRSARARPARTHLRCVQTVGSGRAALSWVVCRLDTGRTHQIRVHLESIGHPLVGDPVYRRGRPGAAPAAQRGAPAAQRGVPAAERGVPAAERGVPAAERGAPAAGSGVAAAGSGVAAAESGVAAWQSFPRQALHACRLSLVHPALRTTMTWFRAPPADMRALMRDCGFAGGDAPVEAFGVG
jgi:23S rRNA pseudouridine1911/1915/1917 synthase